MWRTNGARGNREVLAVRAERAGKATRGGRGDGARNDRQFPGALLAAADSRLTYGGGRSCADSAGPLAMPAPRPAAGPTLAFLQLLLGAANAAFSGHLLLGVLDPADELVAGQRRDVLPSIECRGVGHQRLAQVCGKPVHYPARHTLAAHAATVASRCEPGSPPQRPEAPLRLRR